MPSKFTQFWFIKILLGTLRILKESAETVSRGTLSKLIAVHRGSEITLLVHPARIPRLCPLNGAWSNNGSHNRATGHTRLGSSNEKGRAGEVRTFSVFWASFFWLLALFSSQDFREWSLIRFLLSEWKRFWNPPKYIIKLQNHDN